VFDVPEPELDVFNAVLLGVLRGFFDHLGRHVDADDLACLAHPVGGQETVEAGPASQVEYRLAFLERRQGNGVSAPQTQIGALRYGGQFVF